MLEQNKIDRINFLAKKKKEASLTHDEIIEQRTLREEFLADFRQRFKAQLDNIEFVENQKPEDAVGKEKVAHE